ncbi:hypothetical protein [Paenibacillus ginsengarvi]|uniref:Uncharacterized protein n=1 Tax=Paenibacillus ginsengarvi TaxID=400777 RepID=A0A3B0AMB1_9BACL|nr:hypothetical protein [Paenibacillus ginsengarvi]RKN61394.1 hypothetical protein D7M11_35390 [Paenibacillus ginsengarvi]
MNRRLFALSAVLAVALALMPACNYQKRFESGPSDYGSRTETHEKTGFHTYNTQLRAADHNNTRLDFVQSVTDAVDELKGIRSSLVFVTDKNVYVAAVLDNTATGMKGKGTVQFSDRTIASGQNALPDRSYELPPGNIVMDKYSFDTVPSPHDLSSELVRTLDASVRQYYPDAANVFVSANKDFINRFSEYAHEAWRGQSLQPYLNDFNALVKDHFGDHGVIDLNP